MELGPTTGPLPEIPPISAEFCRKAEVAGVPVRPSLKVKEPVQHPKVWGVQPGSEVVVAYFGTLTDRPDAVEVLSKVDVAASVVMDVRALTPTQAEEFQAQAREVAELRKRQLAVVEAAAAGGRHAARPAATTPTAAVGSGEVAELLLATPAEARRTPLNVLELLR